MYNRTTVQTTIQGATFSMHGQLYHGHYLIISPLHGHGEVANENPLILPRTLSIVGALVLLKRCVGKKMRALLLGLTKSIYYHPGWYFCNFMSSFCLKSWVLSDTYTWVLLPKPRCLELIQLFTFVFYLWKKKNTSKINICIFLYSNYLSACYCIDIVRRNSVLVTHGS